MRKINYKSDFDFVLRMKDCADPEKTVPFPEGNFDARFWASNKANSYTASCRDGVYTNCFRIKDGGMHFVFDNHRLGIGALKWEPHFEFPNDIYPDGIQDLFRKARLDIELVDGDGDCPTTAEVEAILPYIKGDKGDKGEQGIQGPKGDKGDGFTAEQIEKLNELPTVTELNSEIDEAKRKVFDDLWREAFKNIGYDWRSEFFNVPNFQPINEDGLYCTPGVDEPLTYAEAVNAYNAYVGMTPDHPYGGFTGRGVIPVFKARQNLNAAFFWCKQLEAVVIASPQAYIKNCIYDCEKLRRLYIGNNVVFAADAFNLSSELEVCEIFGLASNLWLHNCPLIHAQSLRLIINYRNNDNQEYVLTLHPTVYQKIIDGDTGWDDLLSLAQSKHIQFATL